ncbi:hypothetical protein UA08_01133 [Talaromyces atroroseus]|uniref:NADAR domain-containing protein n=1 Tax=Talaromyces atroroseus TaxID=1441469 RepID=A0A1Q5Q9L4_TALAT|nr:hypothetical protein UA08_01133 [Talaromyces atroroseus]OKL62614.1 hypothetical protein UA08_01133 [Talaromyces atroroseus]
MSTSQSERVVAGNNCVSTAAPQSTIMKKMGGADDADDVVFFWKIDQAFLHDVQKGHHIQRHRECREDTCYAPCKSCPAQEDGQKGFEFWSRSSKHMVVNGNFYKFVNNPKLMQMLMSTGNKVIAEASSLDNIWGIGFDANNAIMHKTHWGEKRLSKCLTEVRDMIRDMLSQISNHHPEDGYRHNHESFLLLLHFHGMDQTKGSRKKQPQDEENDYHLWELHEEGGPAFGRIAKALEFINHCVHVEIDS